MDGLIAYDKMIELNSVTLSTVNGKCDTIDTTTKDTKTTIDGFKTTLNTINTNASKASTAATNTGTKVDNISNVVNSINSMVTTQHNGMSMVKRILRGVGEIPTTDKSITVNIGVTINPSKSIIILNGGFAKIADSDNMAIIYCSALNPTTVTVAFCNDRNPRLAVKFSWQIIEFD